MSHELEAMQMIIRYVFQGLLYLAFALVIGYFATQPTYTHLEPGMSLLKVSFSHPGQPITECHRRTQEELDALAPNMRKPSDCPRERVSLVIELDLDGEPIFRDSLPPSGLSSDGASTAYERFPIEPGTHQLSARLRDSRRSEGFDWSLDEQIEVRPGQNFVIDFEAGTGGFKIL